MLLRLVVLAAALVPLALASPTMAADATSALRLAQADPDKACSEDAKCPPVEEVAPEQAPETAEESAKATEQSPADDEGKAKRGAGSESDEQATQPTSPQDAVERAERRKESLRKGDGKADEAEEPAEQPKAKQAEEQPKPKQAEEQPKQAQEQPKAKQAEEQPKPKQAEEQPKQAEEQPKQAQEQPKPKQAQEQQSEQEPAAEKPKRRSKTSPQGAGAAETDTGLVAEPSGGGGNRESADSERPRRKEAEQKDRAANAAAEADDTVGKQLEAQGDDDEAKQVRDLRKRLVDELRQATGAPAAKEDEEPDRIGHGDRGHNRGRFYDRREGEGDVVDERAGRIIIDLGNGRMQVEPVVPDDGGRLLYRARGVNVDQLPGGRTRTVVVRQDGSQIVTVRDRYGNVERRVRKLPNGREIVLIDSRLTTDGPRPDLRRVQPPHVGIARDRYVIDLGRASRQQVREALLAPPVDRVPRPYTLNEVLTHEQIRAYSPRIDLDTITFDFGRATIGPDQMNALLTLGNVMEDVLAQNPDEVYLIEGHTDAVGSDYDNLILSDRRAEAVAVALSQNFDIPPENLVTQGYGEQYLKVQTQEPERRNRRATVRRLTELLRARN